MWNWFTGEVMPIGDLNTKIVIIGNLLHEDSLMMRLKESINGGKMDGVYKEYPLLDKNDNIAWLGKYPSMMHIETKRRQVADESAWYREYLLKFISDDKRIVQRNWPKFYDKLPDLRNYRILGIGIDLAISEKSSADFTALVPFIVVGYGDDLKIYILPHIVNKRVNFPDTILEIKKLCAILEQDFKRVPMVFVENVSYQMAVVQQLTIEKVLAEPVAISGMNKQTRLEMATPYIRQGKVLFPQQGAESLISQIVNFGIEKHDDLVDAFTIIVLKVLESDRPTYKSTEPPKPPRDNWGIDPFTGEYRNLDAPITAGMLDMVF